MKQQLLTGLVCAALAVASCNPSSKKSAATDNLKAFTAKLDSIAPALGNPSQTIAIFQLADVGYNKALVNDPMKYEAYTADSMVCAANIGVYMADALYQYATENKDGKYIKEDMYMSLAAAISLAKSVGMEESFQNLAISRYEENKITADSIIGTLNQAFQSSNQKAAETATMRFFLAMAIGNQIEKEYILLNSIIDNPKELPAEAKLEMSRQMILILKHQLDVGSQLITLAESLKNESDPGTIITKFKELNAVYASMDFSPENMSTITPEKFYSSDKLIETYRLVKEMRGLITLQK
jgi:hypothetical protein